MASNVFISVWGLFSEICTLFATIMPNGFDFDDSWLDLTNHSLYCVSGQQHHVAKQTKVPLFSRTVFTGCGR